jgi:hypothetical protein
VATKTNCKQTIAHQILIFAYIFVGKEEFVTPLTVALGKANL